MNGPSRAFESRHELVNTEPEKNIFEKAKDFLKDIGLISVKKDFEAPSYAHCPDEVSPPEY